MSYSLEAIEIQLSARSYEIAALTRQQKAPKAHASILVDGHSRRQHAEAVGAMARIHAGSTAKALL